MLKKIMLFAFVAVLLASCSSEPSVVGHWSIEKVQFGEDVQPTQDEKKSLEFMEDGTFHSGENGKKVDRDGTWEHDAEKNILTMLANDGNRDDGDYKVEKLTEEEFIITRDDLKVTMKRLDTSLE